MKHEEHTPSSLHLEQQLAEVLAPLGVQAEEQPEQSPPSFEIIGEDGIRITTYYLYITCEHASRLSIAAKIIPFLSYHQSDAICVIQGDTRKSKRGYLIFGAPTPFRRVVTTWVDAQDDITDWLRFSAVADIDVEA